MYELFHVIAEADSAAARKLVVTRSLERVVRFRNLTYPEVQEDFTARLGTVTPAVWDGERLHQGLDAVTAVLLGIVVDG
jgi:hypothetical protein